MSAPDEVILLRESSQPQTVRMTDSVAAEIGRRGIATVTPLGDGEWSVARVARVGVLRMGAVELRIAPKLPLNHLFFLLSRTLHWDDWQAEHVALDSIDQLYPAIAELFARNAEQVLLSGILRAYREQRAADSVIRGRWLISEQIRIRHGIPLPAELSFDEFTIDINENRMLRSAAQRLLRAPGLRPSLRRRLHRMDAQLGEAQVFTPGRPLPLITFDRRNARYQTPVGLARLVLEDASLEHGIADVSAAGFLLTMSTVFERFIEAEFARAAGPHGGDIRPQKRDYLDRDAQILVKPDLVWMRDGAVRAVFDAKYKAEKPAGFPNADIYQMLAYCIRHAVAEGHLIYAAGDAPAAQFVVEQAGITVVCHVIRLDVEPGDIMAQIDDLINTAIGADRT